MYVRKDIEGKSRLENKDKNGAFYIKGILVKADLMVKKRGGGLNCL